MRWGNVCTGIDAAGVAWHPLGWEMAWLSEIDKAAAALLDYRFPDIPNLGDMTRIADQIDIGLVEAPDGLVGGTPCQGFSVAGRRGGLTDPRGQLTLSFVEIADAIDRARRAAGQPECVVLWENVPGVLSMRDNAFGNFLAALAGEDVPLEPTGKRWADAGVVLGPERTIAWRVLDAQFFGLAQRRKRVFVVASARDGFDPGEVLLEWEGVRRDSAPSRKTGESVAGTLDARTEGGGFPGTDGACSGHVVPADGHRLTNRVSRPEEMHETVGTLCADTHPGAYSGQDAYTGRLVPVECVTGDITHTLKAEGFDASEDGTGRGQPIIFVHGSQDPIHNSHLANAIGRNNGLENCVAFSAKDHGADATDDLSPTLRAGGHSDSHPNGGVMPAVCYAFKPGMSEAAGSLMPTDDLSPTLQAADNGSTRTPAVAYGFQPRIARNGRGDMGEVVNALTAQAGETGKGDAAPCVAYAIQERAVCENPDAGPDGMGVRSDDCAYTLEARAVPQAVAFVQNSRDEVRLMGGDGQLAAALNAEPGSHQQTFIADIVPFDTTQLTHPANYSNPQPGDPCHPLAAGAHAPSIIEPNMAVRRLMPVECERLQGFPDGWTRIPVRLYDTQQTSDTRPVDMWESGQNGGWWLMAADGPRYKQLGNSMAVAVMRWIGRRIGQQVRSAEVRNLIG